MSISLDRTLRPSIGGACRYPRIRIVRSVEPLECFSLRSESRRLVACSVGLRLWDRDGYFSSPTLRPTNSSNLDRLLRLSIGGIC